MTDYPTNASVIVELTLELPPNTRKLVMMYVGRPYEVIHQEVLNKSPERMPTFTLYPIVSENPFSNDLTYSVRVAKRKQIQENVHLPFWYPDPVLTVAFSNRSIDDVLKAIMSTYKKQGHELEYGVVVGDSDGVVPIEFKARTYGPEEISALENYLSGLEGAILIQG